MSETKVNSAGQKVTTYYKENEREEEVKARNAERIQQNKNKRGDQEGAVPKIKRVVDEVAGVINRHPAKQEPTSAEPSKKAGVKDRSVPPRLRGMPAIMGSGGGMPSWLEQPSTQGSGYGKRHKGQSPAPRVMQMGTGLPSWYFAQPPGNQSRKKGGSGLPDWFFR